MRDVVVRWWWREIGDRWWWTLRRRREVVEEIRVMGKVWRALNVPVVMVVVGRKIHREPVGSYRIRTDRRRR